jgi:DNA polymerase-3 subunit beta
MQLVIEKSALLKALSHVTSIVERRNTIPILSNVLLIASGDHLCLTATDLEREVIEKVPAKIGSEGGTTVQAHVLHDIVRKLPDGADVELSRGDDDRVMLAAGKGRYDLQALPSDDFPELSTDDLSHKFSLKSADLKQLIEKTKFAISTEETRYYLNGIYLHEAETDGTSMLRAVATDGHRLAQVEVDLPDGASGLPGVIIPRKTVAEVQRMVADTESDVTIEMSDAKIRFSVGDLVMTSKLIDGTFPDYSRVIPTANDKALSVSREVFAKAVDRVSTLSSDRGRAVKLNLSDQKLILTVNNPDSGSATEEITVDYNDEELEIGFNARYLMDITQQLESDTANLLLADPGSPTMVRDGDDLSALYVLMPMRV